MNAKEHGRKRKCANRPDRLVALSLTKFLRSGRQKNNREDDRGIAIASTARIYPGDRADRGDAEKHATEETTNDKASEERRNAWPPFASRRKTAKREDRRPRGPARRRKKRRKNTRRRKNEKDKKKAPKKFITLKPDDRGEKHRPDASDHDGAKNQRPRKQGSPARKPAHKAATRKTPDHAQLGNSHRGGKTQGTKEEGKNKEKGRKKDDHRPDKPPQATQRKDNPPS
ncbi:hypothetical protein ACROYT_G002909 [Oculina patagonica]